MKFKLKETCAKINGWPNYEVSTYGNVRNVKTGKILKPFIENKQKPYLRVELFNNGKGTKLYVHVLVVKAFLPDTGRNPDGTIMVGNHQVNHRDENKQNNNVLNLEWTDYKYNLAYSNMLKKVQCIETGVSYESAYAAERALNLIKNSISKQINHKCHNKHCYLPDGTKIHFKYIWKEKKNYEKLWKFNTQRFGI